VLVLRLLIYVHSVALQQKGLRCHSIQCSFTVDLWCSNRDPRATCGPQDPLEWPAKQFSFERKLNTLII